MGIQSSLYSGVSGLNANGNALTVLGNNIANSNTIGFKASRTVFSDLLSAEIAGSGGSSQVGRGTGMSTVDNIFSQGTFESTESNTDLAIEGAGFFMVSSPDEATINYTRAGAFRFDEGGTLVNPEGYAVQGYYLNDDGDTAGDITDLTIATRSFSPANPTTEINLSTNLNANDAYLGSTSDTVSPFDISDPADTSNYASSVRVFDSLGREHLMTTYFNKLNPTVDPSVPTEGNPTGIIQWESHTVVAEAEVKTPAEMAVTDALLATAVANEAATATTLAAFETVLVDASTDLADANDALDLANDDLTAATAIETTATATLATAEAAVTADPYTTLLTDRDNAYNALVAVLPATPPYSDTLLPAVAAAQSDLDSYTGVSKQTTDSTYGPLLDALDAARAAVSSQAATDGYTEAGAYDAAQALVVLNSTYNGVVETRDDAVVALALATADQVAAVADQSSADADQIAAAAAVVVATTDRDAAIAPHDATVALLELADDAAAEWTEVGRSILSFDTGGRLVNVKDIADTIASGPSDDADRAYDADSDLYNSTSALYPLPTDLDLVAQTPTATTGAGELSWVNESEPTQIIGMSFNATQYSSESDVISQSQDGYSTGTLVSLTIDNDGNVLGNYSNGEPRKLAKIALAKFSNPLGLSKIGNNMYGATDDSGTAIVGTVGSGVGQIFTNSLEMSNVDLAAEFVKMITTQRGFQANSKIITTTDELLGELINLKR